LTSCLSAVRYHNYFRDEKIPIELILEAAKKVPILPENHRIEFDLEERLDSKYFRERLQGLPHDNIVWEVAECMLKSGKYRFVATHVTYTRKGGKKGNLERIRELDIVGVNGTIDIREIKESSLTGVKKQLREGLKEFREAIRKFKINSPEWNQPNIITNGYSPYVGCRNYIIGERKESYQVHGRNSEGKWARLDGNR